MKTRILRNTLLSLGASLAAVLAPPTVDGQVVAFTGQLNRTTLVSQSCNGGVCNFVFQGSGAVNIMGAVTWTANIVQDFNITPCNTAVGDITFVGTPGSITVSASCGTVCPSATHNGFPNTIEAVWNATGGTGQFSGITGSGIEQGTITGNGPIIHLNGVVVY
jgi:hypothetical protein